MNYDKIMTQISINITKNHKNELIFVYIEIKKKSEKVNEKKNENMNFLHVFAYMLNEITKYEKKIRINKKRLI